MSYFLPETENSKKGPSFCKLPLRRLYIMPFLFLICLFFLIFSVDFNSASEAKNPDYDVIVAGGGIGGMAAAIQASRLGVSVLVVEESSWIGGQATAAGVSTMDDLSRIKSGIYLEFLSLLRKHYDPLGKPMGTCYWDSRSVAFEPSIGQRTLYEMADEARNRKNAKALDIWISSRIMEVSKEGKTVTGVTVKNKNGTQKITCRILIDATEYGDILPLAGAPYRAGKTVSPYIDNDSMIQDITWVAVLRHYPGGIPYDLRVNTPLPGYELARRNYESYVINEGLDFKGVYPVKLPLNLASHNAYRGLPDSSSPWGYDAQAVNWPRITKSCLNWGNDYPGKYGWNGRRGLPAEYLENRTLRAQVEKDAFIKTLHFIYYLQHDLGVNWSIANDEYNHSVLPEAAEGLPYEWQEIAKYMPPIPYVRESRRVIGKHTLTSAELLQNSLSYRDGQTNHEFKDAIAIGGYILDLHGADTDSDMEWELGEKAVSMGNNRPRGPFQVPMNIMIPENTDGLLAAEKNLSMSRLTAGALRLQPICMMVGQAAGALAALSVKNGVQPRTMPAVRVQEVLLDAGVILSLCKYSDVPPEHPYYKAVQMANLHALIEPVEPPHAPSYNISDLDDPVLSMAMIKGHDKGVFGVENLLTAGEMKNMMERARISSGTTAGEVYESAIDPERFVNRGIFADAICKTFGFYDELNEAKNGNGGEKNEVPQRGVFFTLPEHPNAQAVRTLSPKGVLDIYKTEKDFHFGRPITRGEAVEMMMRAMTVAKLP